jgi:hypothetical protein
MNKIFKIVGLVVLGLMLGFGITKAQVPNNPLQWGVSTATHTSCTIVASTTEFCFANDGLWVSINGASYTQVAASGVASVSVCNAAGASCSAALTGAVSVNIPTTVTLTATAPAATVTPAAVSGATTLSGLGTPSVAVAAPTVTGVLK